MSDELKPSSWPGRFLSGCLKIFIGVALLAWAIDVAGRIWPIVLIVALLVGAVWVLIWWLRRRREW